MISWLTRLLGGAPAESAPVPDAAGVMEDVRRQIERDVAGGFLTPDEILQAAVEVFEDEADPALVQTEGRRMLDAALAARAAEQADWPETTDCDRLDAALAALEVEGVISRQNFSCCGTCGAAEIWAEIEAARSEGRLAHGYAFYHWQDTEGAVEGRGLYLNYGACEEGPEAAVAVGHVIVSRLLDHGLRPEWDGRIEKRIAVPLEWKRRRPELAGLQA